MKCSSRRSHHRSTPSARANLHGDVRGLERQGQSERSRNHLPLRIRIDSRIWSVRPDPGRDAGRIAQRSGDRRAPRKPDSPRRLPLPARRNNAAGTTDTPDQTFNFYPPPCPNENVRQQTQTNYLPDCRAYELVSPADAGGTQLFPDGPNTGLRHQPVTVLLHGAVLNHTRLGRKSDRQPRRSLCGDPDQTGWVTRYVGLPSNQAAVDGGPTLGPPGSAPGDRAGSRTCPRVETRAPEDPERSAGRSGNEPLPRPGMTATAFLGGPESHADLRPMRPTSGAQTASFLDRLPTNLGTVANGSYA